MQAGSYWSYYPDAGPRRFYVRVIKEPFVACSGFVHAVVHDEQFGLWEFGLGSIYHLALRPVQPGEWHPWLSMLIKSRLNTEEEMFSMPKRGSKKWGTLAELQAKGLL